jgi:WD40-like Beta Propeller Repeat
MRAEALVLLFVVLSACAGANLSLGDGRAADSGMGGTLPLDPDAGPERTGFGPPRVIAELESDDVSDDDPSLTADLLLLCFNSKRDAGLGEEDVWCSRRARTDEAWGTPEPQTVLNSEHRETGIALSLDGLALWFSSDRAGDSNGLDVYLATRPTRDSAWSEPTRVPELSSQDDELVSSIDETGLRLMLARRTRTDSDDDQDEDEDDYDILLAERTTLSEPWQAPSPVSELNTDQGESDAFLVGDGLALLFTRDADLMLAQRKTLDAGFDQVEALDVLNSDQHERDAWSNSAFTYIVFSSDRAGSFRLYESDRANAGK